MIPAMASPAHKAMLRRFCLYGFLKNQRYFEPFFMLILLEKGLSFTAIGFLIGFREVCINVMEVPSGALADRRGRRRTMILSFLCYIASFALFGVFDSLAALYLAMLLFAIGEAFRTGTHKAMIFDYLAAHDLSALKTQVYGVTRSWSKTGSAVSVVLSTALLFIWQGLFAEARLSHIFLLSIIPYAIGIVNFTGYPASLDGAPRRGDESVWRHITSAYGFCWKNARLRRLLVQSMSFEGLEKTIKDYVQPVLVQMSVALPLFLFLADDPRRVTLLMGIVYLMIFLVSAYTSRRAAAFSDWSGGEAAAGQRILWITLILFACWIPFLSFDQAGGIALIFIAFAALQNLWVPTIVTRFMNRVPQAEAATYLSIRSQSKALFTAVAAPLLGLAVDAFSGQQRFVPVGIFAAGTILLLLVCSRSRAVPTVESREGAQ